MPFFRSDIDLLLPCLSSPPARSPRRRRPRRTKQTEATFLFRMFNVLRPAIFCCVCASRRAAMLVGFLRLEISHIRPVIRLSRFLFFVCPLAPSRALAPAVVALLSLSQPGVWRSSNPRRTTIPDPTRRFSSLLVADTSVWHSDCAYPCVLGPQFYYF